MVVQSILKSACLFMRKSFAHWLLFYIVLSFHFVSYLQKSTVTLPSSSNGVTPTQLNISPMKQSQVPSLPTNPRDNDCWYMCKSSSCLHFIKSSSWAKSMLTSAGGLLLLSAYDIRRFGGMIVCSTREYETKAWWWCPVMKFSRNGEMSRDDADGRVDNMAMVTTAMVIAKE